MHYVIAGTGPAGVIAAETLRKTDPKGRITLVGEEPEPPYSRMAIPYLLVEQIDEGGTYLRKRRGHYRDLHIDLLQDRVASVEPTRNRVTLGGGQQMQYDQLLVATGSKPILPPLPGIDAPGVHNCWTLQDARQILRLARPGARVVLIGAGFIGCIILEALVARGVELTVVETGDRMVPRMMNATAGGMIKAWCERKGVTVFTDTSVTGIEYHYPRRQAGAAPPPRLEVSLNNGHDVRADLVISAAGVRANTDILQDTVVEIDRGILVSHYFRSSVPNIYAAGDACQGRDFSTGTFAVHAIQPTAVEHGRVAALNMAGRPTFYPGSFNMNILDTLGLISTSFGLWMGVDGGEQSELSDPQRYRYINLQFQDDVMVGATVLGHTQHVGVLRGLIQGKVRLGDWRRRLMADPTRVVEAYLARNAGAMAQGLV